MNTHRYVPKRHTRTADEKNQMDNLLLGIKKIRETATGKPCTTQGESGGHIEQSNLISD